jgi:hypothetical protein
MTGPRKPEGDKAAGIESAMDMPERAGQCAFLGGYVPDGATVTYFGEDYVCRAPRLVKKPR